MPSLTETEQQAIDELDAFFDHHATALTPERIAIEIERLPNRYNLSNPDILLTHIQTRLNETTPDTHPELHSSAKSYLRIKWLEQHGNADEIFDTSRPEQ